VLLLGSVSVVVSFAAIAALSDAVVVTAIDDVQQLAATLAAAVALLLTSRYGPPDRRFAARSLALVCGLVAVGLVVWDVQPGSWSEGAGPGDALFAAAVVVLAVSMTAAVFRGLNGAHVGRVALDAVVLLVASGTVLAEFWQRVLDPAQQNSSAATGLACGFLAIAGPSAIFLALLHRRVQPRFCGVHAVLFGVTLVGLAMVAWETLVAHGMGSAVSATDFMYSAGILVIGYGGATWDLSVAPGSRFLASAQRAVDVFPSIAVAVCVTLVLVTPNKDGIGIAEIGTGSVVLMVLVRQQWLTTAERRARAAEREVGARLEGEVRARATVLKSLTSIDAADTPEETARRICEEALKLDGIDYAVVRWLAPHGEALVLGCAGAACLADDPITTLSPERTAELAGHAASGPWAETLGPSEDPAMNSKFEAGLRGMASAPLLWNDQVVGVIGLAATSVESGPVNAERLTTVREFGLVAGPLLGPALAQRSRLAVMYESVARVIANGQFHPVFQPIIDLADGRTVGYEALTRFDSGERPDLFFANAAAVGLGILLESTCLRAAQQESASLPARAWLSLNVSPALAVALVPLIAALEFSEREMVLEITEHAPIEDYVGLAAALDGIRNHMRIAVDDAGAGYAGLQHILQIRPDIVKLDIALVRGVDSDPVRRALIAGMVAFASESGCVLLAEGIETAAELTTLRILGVSLGQGYLLGRPQPIDAYLDARPADRPLRTEGESEAA
jgi:EAL domain-containing protein (putative c-di-GMP-specific phosphodiesterase class I)